MSPRIDRIERVPALIVGAGVAGLSAALAFEGCTVLTKCPLGEGGSTAWAQGGVAAAVDPDDTPEQHAGDTVKAGGGIVDLEAVEHLTQAGPRAIQRLLDMGARFDRTATGALALSREGGHGRRRVVHSEGDATGFEILRTLTEAARARSDIEIVEGARGLDLIRIGRRVAGLLARHADGELCAYLSPATILATGGAGRAYKKTTNPPEATGDGLAMAIRAGAEVADLEFVQFHPTALDADLDPMPLLTEALRGDGAILINDLGVRFMADVHPDAELAPRDVVARSIWSELQRGRRVFLDATQVMSQASKKRYSLCRQAAAECGLDPEHEPLPVSPAAHYFIGGVSVDANGRSSLPGLWAIGEASSTGVHGANRLASNSLLEGMVFGPDTALAIRAESPALGFVEELELPAEIPGEEQLPDAVAEIRQLMWDCVGVVRDRAGLKSALKRFELLEPALSGSIEGRNLLLASKHIALAALERTESRGTHFRSDFPNPDPAQAHRSVQSFAPSATRSIRLQEPAGVE